MCDLLIRNAILVTPDGEQEKDLAIQNGRIAELLLRGTGEGYREIDAHGNYAFPGAIDTHAHLNDPGYTWREDFAHGTAAAAVGGYTTIIDMPLQNEPAITTAVLMEHKTTLVAPNACVDFALWGGLIPENLAQLSSLNEMGCVAFKVFLAPVSPDYRTMSYGQTYEAMQVVQRFGGRIGFHCEDYSMIKHLEEMMKHGGRFDGRAFLDSRPVSAEMIATEAVIAMA